MNTCKNNALYLVICILREMACALYMENFLSVHCIFIEQDNVSCCLVSSWLLKVSYLIECREW